MGLFSHEPETEKITREMSIVKILSSYPLAREVLKRHGIEFIGRQLSPLESLETVANGNNLEEGEIDKILQEINGGMKKAVSELFSGEILTLTPKASSKLKELLERKGKKGIRFRLASDGCGLYSYDMDFGTKKLEGEMESKANGIKFYLDRKSIGLIKGLEIDYKEQQGGFMFNNPNVKDQG